MLIWNGKWYHAQQTLNDDDDVDEWQEKQCIIHPLTCFPWVGQLIVSMAGCPT